MVTVSTLEARSSWLDVAASAMEGPRLIADWYATGSVQLTEVGAIWHPTSTIAVTAMDILHVAADAGLARSHTANIAILDTDKPPHEKDESTLEMGGGKETTSKHSRSRKSKSRRISFALGLAGRSSQVRRLAGIPETAARSTPRATFCRGP